MEIVTERLNREHGMDLIATAPNVAYKIVDSEGKEKRIESPSETSKRHFGVLFVKGYNLELLPAANIIAFNLFN